MARQEGSHCRIYHRLSRRENAIAGTRCLSHKTKVMNEHNQNPYINVGAGERRIVPQGVSALVRSGGTVVVNHDGNAALEKGAVGFVLAGGDIVFLDGADVYLQVNTTYLAGMDWFSVQNGLGINDAKVFYAMPKWFWQRKDWRHSGRK